MGLSCADDFATRSNSRYCREGRKGRAKGTSWITARSADIIPTPAIYCAPATFDQRPRIAIGYIEHVGISLGG
jgi:hypothetical protein